MIAVCGEAVVDLVPTGDASYVARPGGSPANTAVALARLGTPVTLLARLSGDGFGRLLRAHLQSNGVDLSRSVEAAEESSAAVLTRAADGSASYRFLIDGTADWQWTEAELAPLPRDVVAVHSGSLALLRCPPIETFLERARGTSTVCVDPNLRPGRDFDHAVAVAAMSRWLVLADVVKVSTDDVALLHPDEPWLDVARRWCASGPALVVVTAGPAGATAVSDSGVVHREAVAVDVVDTVGAGDTFTAGLLHSLHRRGLLGGRLDGLRLQDVAAALDTGLHAAAVTCARLGADPPFAADLPPGVVGGSHDS